MEPFKDEAELIAELRRLRPAPRPAFAAALDQRAAAGFPRAAEESAIGRLIARLRTLEARRALIPAGATALAAVAAVTVIVALNEPSSSSDTSQGSLLSLTTDIPDSPGGAPEVQPQAAPRPQAAGAGSNTSAKSNTSSQSGVEASATPPVASGPYAATASKRDIERSAQMVLGTDAAHVAEDADQVFEAVHAHDGIVLRSAVRDGGEGEAGASFELLIPSGKLGDALAAFSGIAEVRSRHETTADITAPTVRRGELLRDSRARIDSLLAQLAAADTDAERASAESALRAERRHNAFLRSQLSELERRANFSRVSLRIDSGEAASGPGGVDGSWGVVDALEDSVHILGIAAAVAIVGIAVLAPIALIAVLAWLGNRARVRRGRQRALG
jgi:hypothetical protein